MMSKKFDIGKPDLTHFYEVTAYYCTETNEVRWLSVETKSGDVFLRLDQELIDRITPIVGSALVTADEISAAPENQPS